MMKTEADEVVVEAAGLVAVDLVTEITAWWLQQELHLVSVPLVQAVPARATFWWVVKAIIRDWR